MRSRMLDRQQSEQSGFTLIETLIALFVVSLLTAAGAAILMTTLQAGRQVESHTEILRELEIAHAQIRDDIAAMTTRQTVPASGYESAEALRGLPGGADGVFLLFTRGGWSNPDIIEERSDLQRVAYRLENGRLIRTAWLRPDATGSTPTYERTLLSGIQRIDLRYARNGSWSEEWRASALEAGRNLPDVIEIVWTFSDEDSLRQVFPAGGRVS